MTTDEYVLNLEAEIERLRAYIKQLDRREGEMADEIERLRSENENMHDSCRAMRKQVLEHMAEIERLRRVSLLQSEENRNLQELLRGVEMQIDK